MRVSALQQHFETEEREDLFLSRWLTLRFSEFKDRDATVRQLEDYATELRHMQKGLEPLMQTDKESRNRLLHDIPSDPRLQTALFQLPETTQELIDDLRVLAGFSSLKQRQLPVRNLPESAPVRQPLCKYCYENCEAV